MNIDTCKNVVSFQTKFLRRLYSAKSLKRSKELSEHCDLVGEPNPITNLRPIRFHIPPNETEIEKKYRLKREEVQKWNEGFWLNHNTRFFEKKAEYVKAMMKTKSMAKNNREENVTADEMSSFYTEFLNENWKKHLLYNFEWYKKNASLVFLSFQVKWSRLKSRLFSGKMK